MNTSVESLQYNKLLSTDLIKVVAIVLIILNHTINYMVIDKSVINKQYYLIFWVYQAVSLFVVITGVHFSKSMENIIYEQNENDVFWEKRVIYWYNKNNFIKKIGRILLPYTIEQIVSIAICTYKGRNFDINDIFFKYISGGVGPGGYYTVCMLQIIVIFPVLYFIIRKYKLAGGLFILIINMLYELMVKYGMIDETFNRLCSVRLFTGVMLGIVIYCFFQRIQGTAIPCIWFVWGIGILAWSLGGGYKFQIASGSWVSSSFAVVPYAAAGVYLVISQEEKIRLLGKRNFGAKKFFNIISFISRATYHIFLVQQLYFCFDIYSKEGMRLREAGILDIGICIIIGCLFYYLQRKLLALYYEIKQARKQIM